MYEGKSMKYYVREYVRARNVKPGYINNSGTFIILTTDNWDDYGYETTFYIDCFKEGVYNELGLIRILEKDSTETRYKIPKEFESLELGYISLGYNKLFYESLIDVFGKDVGMEILKDLNDISVGALENNPNFNIEHPGIQASFFRSSDARYLYEEVLNVYFENQKSTDRDYEFTFKFEVNKNSYTSIEVDFSKHRLLPNRLFALIGKNGVGKTRFLNQLSECLYDSSKPRNKNRFIINNEFEIPTYQKIIAISFSVFDTFFKGGSGVQNDPEKENEIDRNVTTKANYTYIGLHKVDETVFSIEEVSNTNIQTFEKLKKMNRAERFVELLNKSRILHSRVSFQDMNESFFYNYYSSGQNIFISMLGRLLSEIEDGSLVFLDEPELYLHPNAIASLMKIFLEILKEYQSYAILCTHSPILVQEMPSRYVRNLALIEKDLVQTQVSIETFGANVSDITKDIYDVTESESLYKTTLKELSKTLSEEEIEAIFEDRLSFKARMFLSSLYIHED